MTYVVYGVFYNELHIVFFFWFFFIPITYTPLFSVHGCVMVCRGYRMITHAGLELDRKDRFKSSEERHKE